MELFLGFDIGGTKCAVVLGDKNGNVLKKERFETTDYETSLRKLLEAGDRLFTEQVVALGVSCGGPLDSRRGLILSPPNLPGWDEVPIVQLLEDRFHRPAFLKNDADACAIAEWKWGNAAGYDHAIFLTCSTGMGSGLIINGKPYAGSCDMAGEVGHIRLHPQGHIGYGKAGSFEGCCSGGGMAQYGLGSAKELAEAARRGDAQAMEIYRQFGEDLGRGIAVLVDILNPQVIVLGSIYQRAQDLIEPHMRKLLEQEALPHSLAELKILPAKLGDALGDMAALGVAYSGYSLNRS